MKIRKFRKVKILSIIDDKGWLKSQLPCTKVEYTPIARVVKAIDNRRDSYSETVFELPHGYKLKLSAGFIKIKL